VGPKAGLDRCGKSRSPTGYDLRTVQPVASRYTDYATRPIFTSVKKGKVHPCTGTEALYRPYDP